MQSQIGAPKSYSLDVSRNGTVVDVILRSDSGDYVCRFTGGRDEGDGFTFGPSGPGRFWCDVGGQVKDYLCANGERRDLFAIGHNLFGRISENDISGSWDVSWEVSWDELLETTTEFSGSR
jgi:hypothetical protein